MSVVVDYGRGLKDRVVELLVNTRGTGHSKRLIGSRLRVRESRDNASTGVVDGRYRLHPYACRPLIDWRTPTALREGLGASHRGRRRMRYTRIWPKLVTLKKLLTLPSILCLTP